jgi:excisionase family DNA binding protein
MSAATSRRVSSAAPARHQHAVCGPENCQPTAGASEVMKAEEAARFLHCHKDTLYEAVKSGQLPFFRIGTELRFTRASLARWPLELARRETERPAGGERPGDRCCEPSSRPTS